MTSNNYNVESVIRALHIIEILADQGECRVTDLALETGYSKNTVFRMLYTLMDRGYVRQLKDSSYKMTFKLVNISEMIVSHSDLNDIARPYLEELRREFSETVTLGVINGTNVVFVQRVLGNQPYHTSYNVGSHGKAHCLSLGKAILAYSPPEFVETILESNLEAVTQYTIVDPEHLAAELRVIAERGYAINCQENVIGISSVGAPIFDRTGDVIAAIAVSGLSIRMTEEVINTIAERVMAVAAGISNQLGYSKRRLNIDPA